MLGLFWARVIVGVVLLAPIAIVLIVARTQSQQQRRDAAITSNSSDDAALAAIAGAARKMIDKSPLAALSLASLAGLISTRHPQALSLLATVLEESDELGRAVPAESSVDSASLRTPTSVADADAGDSLPAYSSVCESREPAK